LSALIKQVKQKQTSNAVSQIPHPKDTTTWYGMFAVNTTKKELYISLSDGSYPNKHQVESSSGGLIFGTNPWINRNGIENIQVFGFVFRYGASFPQRPAVWLHGRNNLIENCVTEEMSGGVCYYHLLGYAGYNSRKVHVYHYRFIILIAVHDVIMEHPCDAQKHEVSPH
jgi:hypothetical protein